MAAPNSRPDPKKAPSKAPGPTTRVSAAGPLKTSQKMIRPMPPPAPKGPKVLRIGVVQNGRIIEERIVRKRETVTIGHSERNHFVIPAKSLPARYDLFEMRGETYLLTFSDDMDGRVSVPSGLADFATLKSSGKAKRKGQYWQVELTEESRGKVVIGESTLLFQFVTPPPIQPRPQLPAAVRGGFVKRIDWPFISITMVTAVIEFGLVLWLITKDWPLEASWQAAPDRFAELITEDLPSEEEIEKIRDELNPTEETDEGAEETPEEDTGEATKNKTPAKQISAEERAARAEAAARAAAERRARLTEAMSRVAMAKILSTAGSGTGAVADVLRGGDVGSDMDEVMNQVKGVGVARGGDGGVLRKVSGGSGDGSGSAVDIGQLRTEGGNKTVESEGMGSERQVRGKVGQGRAAATGGTGTLNPDEVRSTVGRALGGIKACYERALRRNPTLEGRVTIAFTVGGGGRVTSATASNDTIGGEVSSCIVSRFQALRFPPPQGGNVTFSYPFFFQPAQ